MYIWESFTRFSEWAYSPDEWETTEYLNDWTFTPEDAGVFVQSQAFDNLPVINKRKTKHDISCSYYNVPASFDIETTSFTDAGEKRATMYLWTLNFNGACMVGRTWAELLDVMETIKLRLELSPARRLGIGVHNLSYEFQFMRKWFDWYRVFAIDTRKPVQAMTGDGFEFRCTYLLSGYSLAKLAENLHTTKIRKMVGDLDYDVIRHSNSPIYIKELGYAVNDTAIVTAYMREQIAENGKITNVPLTKTGYVRRYCREACLSDSDKNTAGKKWKEYRKLMKSVTLTPDLYRKLKRAFQGGFTHANAVHAFRVWENVESWDFTSSYPYVMLAYKFPMDSGTEVYPRTKAELDKYLNLYCCVFELELWDVTAANYIDHPISSSRCYELENPVLDNGRIQHADRLKITVTEQDYFIYQKFYKWKKQAISQMTVFKRDYLPRDLALAILKLYEDKTQLKGVIDKIIEYFKAKEQVNSCYGMTVTDIVRMINQYLNGDWEEPKEPDIEKEITDYNKSVTRFLFYPWGVWVTAYARRNLLENILLFGNDYLYADTDSIKARNAGTHKHIIDQYNAQVMRRLEKAAEHYGIPVERFSPLTIKGEAKTLGVFDDDGTYRRFKTLGAKRYMYEDKTGLHLTVAGVSKLAIDYIQKIAPGREFDFFDEGMKIPGTWVNPETGITEHPTHKQTHTYIDDEFSAVLTDFKDETAVVHEKSCIHMEPCDYELSDLSKYLDFIRGIFEEREEA